jgi:hypothetical protein
VKWEMLGHTSKGINTKKNKTRWVHYNLEVNSVHVFYHDNNKDKKVLQKKEGGR